MWYGFFTAVGSFRDSVWQTGFYRIGSQPPPTNLQLNSGHPPAVVNGTLYWGTGYHNFPPSDPSGTASNLFYAFSLPAGDAKAKIRR